MGRDGRGRLGSIDLIPEDGQDDIHWALSELNRRERTQAEILFELNERLAAKNIDPVSRSAFNRRSLRMASYARRIKERQEVYSGLADNFTPDDVDKNNIILGEMIKTLINEILDDPDHSPKQAMELARAYLAIIQGQKISTDRRQTIKDKAKDLVGKTLDTLSQSEKEGKANEVLRKVREEIYGIFEK